jgi:hypothetical protein
MATLGIVNIGAIISGDLVQGVVPGDSILVVDDRIAGLGDTAQTGARDADVVLDAHGTTALRGDGVRRLVTDSDLILQLVQADNLRSTLHIMRLAIEHDALARVVLASDTPTGTGVMPLGVLKTVCEISTLVPGARARPGAGHGQQRARLGPRRRPYRGRPRRRPRRARRALGLGRRHLAGGHRPGRPARYLGGDRGRSGPHPAQPQHARRRPPGHRPPAHTPPRQRTLTE